MVGRIGKIPLRKKAIKLKCPSCSYKWSCRSKLQRATCSNCGGKVNTAKDVVVEKTYTEVE